MTETLWSEDLWGALDETQPVVSAARRYIRTMREEGVNRHQALEALMPTLPELMAVEGPLKSVLMLGFSRLHDLFKQEWPADA
jgi:hypothetical protein